MYSLDKTEAAKHRKNGKTDSTFQIRGKLRVRQRITMPIASSCPLPISRQKFRLGAKLCSRKQQQFGYSTISTVAVDIDYFVHSSCVKAPPSGPFRLYSSSALLSTPHIRHGDNVR